MCEVLVFLPLPVLYIRLSGVCLVWLFTQSCSTFNKTFYMFTKVFRILLVRENPA